NAFRPVSDIGPQAKRRTDHDRYVFLQTFVWCAENKSETLCRITNIVRCAGTYGTPRCICPRQQVAPLRPPAMSAFMPLLGDKRRSGTLGPRLAISSMPGRIAGCVVAGRVLSRVSDSMVDARPMSSFTTLNYAPAICGIRPREGAPP